MAPHLMGLLRPAPLPPAGPWRTRTADGAPLSGVLHLGEGEASTLAVVVHGLGGDFDRPYVRLAAQALLARGISVLRLNLRGADGASNHFYHAGLTEDLHAVLRCPALAGFERVHVVGFSLGGHLAVRLAAEAHDPRLDRLVAICPPLDLRSVQQHLDQPRLYAYRQNIMVGLRASYRAAARLGPVPTPWARVRRAKTFYEWDTLTVVPRFGYESPEQYYATVSAGQVLAHVRRPLLLVAAADDPMVPLEDVEPWLATAPPHVTVRITRSGGHVAFPRSVHLGLAERRGVPDQVAAWLSGA